MAQKGVEKLLSGLDVSKAAGPNAIPCRLLKGLSNELAPVLCAIFMQSLNTGELPSDWLKAYITPVFNKGARCAPENYRPVSLTCVPCKILEHIICKHIRLHLEKHGILTPLNHGFRSKFSCETQLLVTLQDLLSAQDLIVRLIWPFWTSRKLLTLFRISACWGNWTSTGYRVRSWIG